MRDHLQSDWLSGKHTTLRFHLLGLAHLPTRREFSPCAYTQKVIKLARMLKTLGHEVLFYGGEGSEVACDEFVPVLSAEARRACYGDYDWRREFFRHDGNDAAHRTFNRNAIHAIRARQQPGDFLLCPMGTYQQPIADALDGMWVVEPGIGYEGIFAPYKVFESYAWMHYLYGRNGQSQGNWYDAVIPNYFDPDDFPFEPDKGDYALFIGRLIQSKGVEIAVQVTRELGMPLILAGQGDPETLGIRDPHVVFVGSASPEQRALLMSEARLAFAPTYYVEPFGGVAVEAQLCGTPVLTTDWGAFSETVLHGVTGYRCRTFDDFLWAAAHIERIRPHDCREWALQNFGMDRVQWMFQEYFSKIADLDGAGWYERRPARQDLDWLHRCYPQREPAREPTAKEHAYEFSTP